MPTNTNPSAPGVDVQYQNPSVVNLVLDSEVVGSTSTGVQLTREAVIAQESVTAQDPLTQLCDLMSACLTEIRKIRILAEQDSPPGLAEDVADEAQDASGEAEEGYGAEGIEEE
jgi:hypothetical protein